MCGICGIANISDISRKIEASHIRLMCDTLIHRGPDEDGAYIDNHVGLGIRRLRVIDLKTGSQPIFNENKSICVVNNGEIYNFKELRERLRAKGHVFSTNSDAEVIVHLYEEDENRFIENLDGMFAFALWDKRNRKLVVARDRLGVKPLYYTVSDSRLLFASEVKAIIGIEEISRDINMQALDYYLSLNYIPSPLTMFKDIYKLPPASFLTLHKGRVNISKYWDITYKKDSGNGVKKEGYYCEAILGLLEEAVKKRLVSDVPLGFFLSGGIDSSAIVALASRFNKPIKTFSIAFKEGSFDESRYARSVSERFGTEHHDFTVLPKIEDILEKVVWHMDEPCADSSAIPVYYLSKMAREQVTVALSGDGGDELFGGYHSYNAYKAARIYRKTPGFLKYAIKNAIKRIPVSYSKVSMDYMAKRFVDGVDLDPLRAHLWWTGSFSETEKDCLYSRNITGRLKGSGNFQIFRDHYEREGANDELTRLLYLDLKTYLSDDILVKVDRMSMANSLEVRSPFLDFKLAEFVSNIPVQFKIRGFEKKYILKKAVSKILPGSVVNRGKKGFSIPAGLWIRTHLKEMTMDLLNTGKIKEQGFFNPAFVSKLLDRHIRGEEDNGHRIWGLLVFSIWHETFIKRKVKV
ncbi:MAG: asparagine synthase (glutamine-hydrolyzing) [Candidatus Gorgyraea atricola]|nr:asparagine synthase (glutamine-hydrolyzing) [Candidatus Gorgyraea atricola]